jgi:HK97 family phage prohead protease
MKRLESLFEFKIADAPNGFGEFSGLANAYNNIDTYGDIVAFGAFGESLSLFLKEGFIGGINHDWDDPIGRPVEAIEQKEGLFVRAMLSSTEDAQKARTLMQEGILRKMSIGFNVQAKEYLDGDGVRSYWQSVGYTPSDSDLSVLEKTLTYWGEVRLIRKANLIEASPVTMPANSKADIVAVKGAKQVLGTEREFEEFLRDAGFSKKAAQTVVSAGYRTLLRDVESEKAEPGTVEVLMADPVEVQAAISQFMEGQIARIGV